jgi:hypothetical protein
MSEVKDVIVQGLWKNNSALVQLLGMCPLLAVTSTATNALGLGLATTLVLTLTNLTISSLRRWTPAEIRIPIYVMIIASVVSVVQMLINAYAFGLYQSLGILSRLSSPTASWSAAPKPLPPKRAGAVGAGRFLHRYGGHLRDVCAGLPARNPRQRHAV